jgi:hypothetical protein
MEPVGRQARRRAVEAIQDRQARLEVAAFIERD